MVCPRKKSKTKGVDLGYPLCDDVLEVKLYGVTFHGTDFLHEVLWPHLHKHVWQHVNKMQASAIDKVHISAVKHGSILLH